MGYSSSLVVQDFVHQQYQTTKQGEMKHCSFMDFFPQSWCSKFSHPANVHCWWR